MAASAKGFLEDTQRLTERIRHTQDMLERTEALLDIRGISTTRQRVSGTRGRDRLADSLDKLQTYRDELAGLLADYMELQRFADRVIARLDDPRHQEVLARRYFEGMKWLQIAKAMTYSTSQVFQLHRNAIAALDAALADARGE